MSEIPDVDSQFHLSIELVERRRARRAGDLILAAKWDTSDEQVSTFLGYDTEPGPGPDAPLAQSVARFHGKEKVAGSIPAGGS